MAGKNQSELTQKETPQGYSPAVTARVRAEALSTIINTQGKLMTKAEKRTDISDVAEVKKVVASYIQKCAEVAICPSFEGIAAALGSSRKWVYEFLRIHPDSETTKYLQTVQTQLAAIRIAAADKGCIDSTFTMFILKNSNLGFTDKHDISIEEPHGTPFNEIDTDEAKRRMNDIVLSIPEE